MKRFIITILILLFSLPLLAIDKGEEIDIYVGGEYVQSMTFQQWKIFSESAKLYSQILIAERKENIDINFHKSPWKAVIGETFTTQIDFTWYREVDGKKIVLKTMSIEQSIDVPKDGLKLPEYRVFYRDVAEVGFPISIIIILILMI